MGGLRSISKNYNSNRGIEKRQRRTVSVFSEVFAGIALHVYVEEVGEARGAVKVELAVCRQYTT